MFSQNTFPAPTGTAYTKFLKHLGQFLQAVLGMRVSLSPEWKRWAEETLKWIKYRV
jgi:hypothetical protein